MESNFSITQNILEKGINASVLRWNVLTNNIANAATPNFKRSDISFAAELNRALESNQKQEPFDAKLQNPKHIPFHEQIDYKKVQPRLQTEFYSSSMNNGNNVDAEFEMSEAAKTSLQYEALTNMISRNYNAINMLLK